MSLLIYCTVVGSRFSHSRSHLLPNKQYQHRTTHSFSLSLFRLHSFVEEHRIPHDRCVGHTILLTRPHSFPLRKLALRSNGNSSNFPIVGLEWNRLIHGRCGSLRYVLYLYGSTRCNTPHHISTRKSCRAKHFICNCFQS
jgi:hypothetical protein